VALCEAVSVWGLRLLTIAQRFNAGKKSYNEYSSPVSGTKEAFDLPLASTNRVRSFRPWWDLGSFFDREPSVETLGYFQQKKEDAKHVPLL